MRLAGWWMNDDRRTGWGGFAESAAVCLGGGSWLRGCSGRTRRTNWRGALEQVAAERSGLWCDGGRGVESVSLSCGRVVENSHNAPSAVVQGREGVVPQPRRCLGNGEGRGWWKVAVLVEAEEGCVCKREGGRGREVRSNKVSGSWRKIAQLLLCPVAGPALRERGLGGLASR
jgi:hypothetical protein